MARFMVVILVLALGIAPLMAAETAAPASGEDAAKAALDQDDWYGQLSLRTGYLHNHDTDEMKLCAMTPLLGWKSSNLEIGAGQSGEVFAALTYDMGSLKDVGINCFLSDVIDLHVGLYVGTRLGIEGVDDAQEEDLIWGACATIFNLQADEGGSEKAQEQR